MSKTIEVGHIKTKAGYKNFGWIKVGETPIRDISIPVGVVNGSETGPTLVVTAGWHACEYPGIDSAIRIYNEVDPKDLRGKIITCPIQHPVAFETATPYVSPIDVNRFHPVPRMGALSSNITKFVNEKIRLLGDCCFDLHGGDVPEDYIPNVIFTRWGIETLDKKTETLADLFPVKYMWVRSARTDEERSPLVDKGIPSMVIEAGGLGFCNEDDVKINLTGLLNVMKYLDMIDGKLEQTPKKKIFEKSLTIYTKHGGLFYPKVKPGDELSAGQVIGEVKDILWNTKEEIIMPEKGVMRIVFPKHVVNADEEVFRVWLY